MEARSLKLYLLIHLVPLRQLPAREPDKNQEKFLIQKTIYRSPTKRNI